MLRAVRVVLANGSLAEARDLQKMLSKAISTVRETGKLPNDVRVGLAEKGEVLARRIDARRHYVSETLSYDPHFLVFEFSDNKMLHGRQVAIISDFQKTVEGGESGVKQMIMGAGKTTVVSPLLSMLLANGKRLVSLVVPSALLEFCRGVLMAVFSSIIQKRICMFHCDRSEDVDIAICDRIEAVRNEGHILLTKPTDVKSLILRFVENLDICNDRRSKRNTAALQKETIELGRVLEIFAKGVCMIDEVDLVLHPLRSELNFPIGPKNLIDFAPHRWQIPLHLLEGIFISELQAGKDGELTPPERFADSALAKDILKQIAKTVADGTRELKMQRSPHLVLLNLEFYEEKLKEVMCSWMSLWLASEHVGRSFAHEREGTIDGGLSDAEVREYIRQVAAPDSPLAKRVEMLPKRDVQMLNLSADWLSIFLPHVLQKINRVTYGIMTDSQVEQALIKQPGMPMTRAKLSIPFIGKASKGSSEFAHPDITIGLTLLSFRYEGLRMSDFDAVLDLLVANLESEPGVAAERPTAMLFKRWVEGSGGVLATRRQELQDLTPEELAAARAAEVREKKVRILPLHMLERSNRRQMNELFKLLRKNGQVVAWYLESIVFPEHLRFQEVKLMSSGQDLGGALLFKERIGFSGTPSDLMPRELGSCDFEPGSEGSIVHTLTNPEVVSFEVFGADWTVTSLLDRIAVGGFHALIDTGALITGLSNKDVAVYLLGLDNATVPHPTLPSSFQGVVFIDDEGSKKILLRQTQEVLNLADCGIPATSRFAFYDQVHTTGMDIQHKRDCVGAITLGKAGFEGFTESMLGDVCGWLVLNSMLSDRLQFNVLQTQNLSNIWRKNAWNTLMEKYALLQLPEIVDCIEVFKEPIDFKVLDKVPVPRGLLQIVQGRADEYTKCLGIVEEEVGGSYMRYSLNSFKGSYGGL
ncbi:unnamed protein product [Symbiodinium pilosum]|uniref:ubiquitinyl hydrolase 1 n=1 Tax=Symbiodinium pilosum TaxID=2952 RepID=A0A812VWK4_SYMPI|nr:unnamed protein product [Symbiodinium pilosum]